MSVSKASADHHWDSSSAHSTKAHVEHIDRDTHGGQPSFPAYPNRWFGMREQYKEYFAEFLGTMILIIFGNGVNCQVVLSTVTGVASSPQGSYLSISFGWGIGTALGVWVSGGISGGHINPAVTIALATWRNFPWKKVPGFILAQVLGGLCGAGVIYANYIHAIDVFEDGARTLKTASLFSTYALDYMTQVSCFFSEFMATAVLLIVVLAIGDKRNAPPAGLAPLILFILILGIGACLGMQTAYAINPARDLGPRLLTSMVGYGSQVYTYRNHYWIWCPIIAPVLGAQAGAAIYDVFLFDGDESIVNKPNATARERHLKANSDQQEKMPAGTARNDNNV